MAYSCREGDARVVLEGKQRIAIDGVFLWWVPAAKFHFGNQIMN